MADETILEIAVIVCTFIFLAVCIFCFLKYVFPYMYKDAKEEAAREFIKTKAELTQHKKFCKLLKKENLHLEEVIEKGTEQLSKAEEQIKIQEEEYIKLKKQLAELEENEDGGDYVEED